MSQIEVVAIVKVKAGKEAEAAEAMKACVAPSRAESTNHAYTPHRDLDAPDTMIFIERWDSREALQAHMETPHFKKWPPSWNRFWPLRWRSIFSSLSERPRGKI